MWPIIMGVLRRNAVVMTLPIAAVVGFIGYNIENLLSEKYTPFSNSVQDTRAERLAASMGSNPENVRKLELEGNVLDRNLSPSLQPKK